MFTFTAMGLEWKLVAGKLQAEKQKVVVLSHRSPDGDSIGSSLGLAHYLWGLGHEVKVISPDPAPPFLHWLPRFNEVINYEKHEAEVNATIQSANLVFCLDFNTPSRMGRLEDAFHTKPDEAFVINIDHHQQPDDFADFQLSDVTSSSTAELVFDFMLQISGEQVLTKEIAACLYTGILTDTGSFRFSSTSPKTHRTVASLMEQGLDINRIYQRIFDNYSEDRIKLLAYALKEKLHLYPSQHAAIIDLSEVELNQFHFQKGDTEGIVNYPLSISWVKMSVLLTQKDGIVKMSFRSKGEFSVNELARTHFSGGGHENAAGGMSKLSMPETVKKLEGIIQSYEEKLKRSEV